MRLCDNRDSVAERVAIVATRLRLLASSELRLDAALRTHVARGIDAGEDRVLMSAA